MFILRERKPLSQVFRFSDLTFCPSWYLIGHQQAYPRGYMDSCLGSRKSLAIKTDKKNFIMQNGKTLLEKMVASCKGTSNPIWSFSAEELKAATNNYYIGNVITDDLLYKLYNGFVQDRQISVMKFEERLNADRYCFTNIVFSSQMSHKNILKLLGCCLETKIPILVFESVGYGTLANHIHDPLQPNSEPLSLKHRLKIAMEIAHGVAYLHIGFPRPIVFRDVKPSGIVFHDKYVAKLFDLSLCVSIPEGKTHINGEVIGTGGFLAPEYLATGDCNEKCDVYSFGGLLLELLTGRRINQCFLLENGDECFLREEVRNCVENNKLNEIVDPIIVGNGMDSESVQQILQAFAELAFKCLSSWGEDRPTMIEVTKQLRQMYQSV